MTYLLISRLTRRYLMVAFMSCALKTSDHFINLTDDLTTIGKYEKFEDC